MARIDVLLKNFVAWTSKPLALRGYVNGDTVNINTALGQLWPDNGYAIDSQIATAGNKAGGTFVHRDATGKEWVWFALNDTLYANDGATTLATSLAETFAPATFNMGSPAGMSGYFTGTNSEAQIVREKSDGTNLEAVALDELAVPTAPTVTGVASGGSMSDGSYLVRVAWKDDGGDVAVFGHPDAAQTATISGGGGSGSITVTEPAGAPTRATHFVIGVTGASGTDTPSSFLLEVTAAKLAGTQTITTLTGTTQAFADINGVYRQATLPITGVDSCWLHEGRLFVASSTHNEVAFSDRDNPNHFYADQLVTSGAESGWNSPVVGGVSAGGAVLVFTPVSVHRVFGTFRRDSQGANASFGLDVGTAVLDSNIGCVGRGTITSIGGVIYFMSTRGPAVVANNQLALIKPDDIEAELRCLDWSYANRWVAAEDPDLNMWVVAVTRKANSSRPQDGAATAGIPDRVLRYDMEHGIWSPPLWLETVHLATRTNAAQNTTSQQTYLMALGSHGTVLQLNYGWSAGGPDDVSGTTYDGLLATADSTTTATVTLSGISANDFVGETVTLFYPAVDTNFPSVIAQRTISANSATSGGSVIVTWTGAMTVPTSTKWTVRIGGFAHICDIRFDVRDYADVPADQIPQLMMAEQRLWDVVGAEAVS